MLSENVSLNEATRSQTAIKYNIDNIPSSRQIKVMSSMCKYFFEPLRMYFCHPIFISSFYRSKELNKRIGGAKYSDHMIDGDTCAMDLDMDGRDEFKTSNNDLFHFIKDHMIFSKLIAEFPDKNGRIAWVHISRSINEKENDKKVLIAHRPNGRTIYSNYKDFKHLVK